MARIFTTPESEAAAKAFMHDILVVGAGAKNLRTDTPYSWTRPTYRQAATDISNELINRDFADINTAIGVIANYSFYTDYNNHGRQKSFKPEVAAKAIVYMAERLGLYWDDTVRTPYEVAEFKKTLLGEAVYKYGRVISAIPDKSPRVRASSSTPSAPKAAPQNDYKQRGPQSGNVRDLRDIDGVKPGQAGEKVFADDELIYKIVADKIGKNTPNVFIKPLSSSGEVNGTNKIFISSGNGYTDCTCYFDDPNDAQAFLDKIIAAGKVPSNITNIHVAKSKADSNGYFLVGTEFGVCAVSAKTLNEALAESVEEVKEELSGWEKATKDYSKEELKELHTWMRRD
jgi:hypothetical protein